MKEYIPESLLRLYRRCRRIWGTFRGTDHMQGAQIRIRSEQYGSSDYGNWTIAAGTLNEDSVVYSAGVGEDVSFDLALIDAYNLTVHAFDPTPRSIEWFKKQQFPEQLVFHPVGIADFDGTAVFHPPKDPSHVSYSLIKHPQRDASEFVESPVRRLCSIMKELGHEHVDLLKLDIEGAEYDVIQDLIDQRLPVRQILIEFHHRFPEVGIQKTRQAIASLDAVGYRIFFVSYMGEEISFLKIPE